MASKRVAAHELISKELAHQLVSVSFDIGRQVGLIIHRSGSVEHVVVGSGERIYLPNLGRSRAGSQHLRGVRHIHTVFGSAQLAKDDLTDLTRLRLDCVAALHVTAHGELADLTCAHLPETPSTQPYTVHTSASLHLFHLNLLETLQAIENQYTSKETKTVSHKERALVLGVYPNKHSAQARIAEISELAQTAGVHVADVLCQIKPSIDPKFFVGKGKLEEAVLRCLELDANVIILDHNLSPAQARAIAASSDLRVIDRTQLILDIFAQHASSRDGKLQVELAQLKYMLPRLTDLDAGLSRLTGGIGGRGPGETKLEINRRRARDRISRLEHEIDKLSEQRALRRRKRIHGELPIVSIVGYTNAGKSTLLNKLTRSDVLVADQLFATLDTTSRRLRFPREREAIITDTVGFIRDLPPDLVKAFRATLEELEVADLLLHVVDASDPSCEEKMKAVQNILKSLELEGIDALLVLNKADQLEPFVAQALARKYDAIAVSAHTGEGLTQLIQHIARALWHQDILPDWHPWAQHEELQNPIQHA